MEYVKNTLEDFLLQENMINKNYLKTQLMLCIIYGLIELGSAHRDLKLNNILVKEDGDEIKAILIDFETSKKIVGEADSVVGTPFFKAP